MLAPRRQPRPCRRAPGASAIGTAPHGSAGGGRWMSAAQDVEDALASVAAQVRPATARGARAPTGLHACALQWRRPAASRGQAKSVRQDRNHARACAGARAEGRVCVGPGWRSHPEPLVAPALHQPTEVHGRACAHAPASVSQGAACVSTRGACARMTAAHQDAVRV